MSLSLSLSLGDCILPPGQYMQYCMALYVHTIIYVLQPISHPFLPRVAYPRDSRAQVWGFTLAQVQLANNDPGGLGNSLIESVYLCGRWWGRFRVMGCPGFLLAYRLGGTWFFEIILASRCLLIRLGSQQLKRCHHTKFSRKMRRGEQLLQALFLAQR